MRPTATLTLIVSLSAALACHAQAPAAQQTPERPLDPAYTIKAGTQLVVLDVVVKDKKGVPVHGLKPSDFSVKENGKPQAVRDFDEHTTLTPAQLAVVPQRPQLPPGEFTNFVPVPPTGALNILLVDKLNTAVKDQMFLQTQLNDYLKHARPDSRTAIYAISNHLILLQGFTSDPKLLLDALTGKNKPNPTLYHDDTTGGLTTSANTSTFGAILNSAASLNGTSFPTGIAAFEAPIQAYQNDMKAYITLDALNDLGRNLITLPGRKNLIWFAGDFPPEFFPSENSVDGPYALTQALDDEFRDTVNLLSRAQVAVYTIDAQGLRTDQSNSASKSNSSYANGGRALARNGSPEAVDHQAEFGNTATEHMAAAQIARDTGGQTYANHNDLARMVSDAIADGANYYTLTYVPSTDAGKDGLRSISVKIEGQSYNLGYRRGYFSDHSKRHVAPGTAVAQNITPTSALQQALQFGSPQPTQILLRAKATAIGAPDQPEIAKGNSPNPDPKINHGPYRVIQIDTAASISEMSFSHGPDNIYHTEVDFVTYVYDHAGTLVNAQTNTVRTAYTKEKLAQAYRSGLLFQQQVSVPAKGEYFLRVAVHDSTSGKLGALEVPVSTVVALAAAPAPPTLKDLPGSKP